MPSLRLSSRQLWQRTGGRSGGGRGSGREGDKPFNHRTGLGYVAPHAGHYADALSKGTNVVLVLVETTGAVHPNVASMLRAWHNEAGEPGHADRTKYGTSRSATRSFFSHHLRLISLAAAIGSVVAITKWARAERSKRARDFTVLDFLPVVA